MPATRQERQRIPLRLTMVGSMLALWPALLPTLLMAQAALPSQTAAASSTPKSLVIDILEGEGELNDVRARTAREPIVEVQDENHKPVAGALVVFTIDSGGSHAPATFSGLSHLAVRTGTDGRAVGRGFTTTKYTGSFHVNVQASYSDVTANAQIHETNIAHSVSTTSRITQLTVNKPAIAFIGEVAAFTAAVISIKVITRDPSSTSVAAGTPVVGTP